MKKLINKPVVYLFLAVLLSLGAVLFVTACTTNPLTGQRTLALVSNSALMASAFTQYNQFLNENTVVRGTPEAQMVQRVGNRIKDAAEKWAASVSQSSFLNQFEWEFNLIQSNEINAWAMPGGKIAFYTGILPVTRDEAGLAVVMGHEVAHVLLNHGQQRVSASLLQGLGAEGLNIFTRNQTPQTQALALTVYGAGSTLFGTLPYSRAHENEADEVGLLLMTIAGYNPEAAVGFWERISALSGGGTPEFLSTHPSDATRIANIRRLIPEARQRANTIGILP